MTNTNTETMPGNDQLLEMYEKMLLIRRVEKQLSEDFKAGRWWWEEEEHKECGLHRR